MAAGEVNDDHRDASENGRNLEKKALHGATVTIASNALPSQVVRFGKFDYATVWEKPFPVHYKEIR